MPALEQICIAAGGYGERVEDPAELPRSAAARVACCGQRRSAGFAQRDLRPRIGHSPAGTRCPRFVMQVIATCAPTGHSVAIVRLRLANENAAGDRRRRSRRGCRHGTLITMRGNDALAAPCPAGRRERSCSGRRKEIDWRAWLTTRVSGSAGALNVAAPSATNATGLRCARASHAIRSRRRRKPATKRSAGRR